MTPQRHEDGTKFIDIPDNEGYRIDFTNLHEQKGVMIEPWVLDYKRSQAQHEVQTQPERMLSKVEQGTLDISQSGIGVVSLRSAKLGLQNASQTAEMRKAA